MARLPRVVLPNTPHHVSQRGNRRQTVFFDDDDYAAYCELIATFASRADTRILAYCLMPNHVHFVMIPATTDGLRATLGEAHRRYAQRINNRADWRGHLWQDRFHSFPMDESHFLMAMRYVELNPVQAGMVSTPEQWPWSSARAHLWGRTDPLVDGREAGHFVGDWSSYLAEGMPASQSKTIESHLSTGRPMGDTSFIERAEQQLNRPLQKRRPGRKPKQPPPDQTGE